MPENVNTEEADRGGRGESGTSCQKSYLSLRSMDMASALAGTPQMMTLKKQYMPATQLKEEAGHADTPSETVNHPRHFSLEIHKLLLSS